MKVTEHLDKARGPLVSVEIIPPKRGGDVTQIYEAIQAILPYNPPFIDVTSHAAEVILEEMPDGKIKRKVKRKSPGTFGLCSAIKHKFHLDPVPHILCAGFTREETEDALIELNYIGIDNLLVLRGDFNEKTARKDNIPDRSINKNALQLVEQVSNLNRGIYQDELIDAWKMDFCIGVACYPEKHFEAPNLKLDLHFFKQKVEAGAHYAVTQMFFDNAKYFSFLELCKAEQINIPIIPGLKIITSKKQLNTIPSNFYINLPDELVDRAFHAKDDKEVAEIGIEWAYQQALELLENGVPFLHFYIMQNTTNFIKLMNKLKKHL
jgi:methylenetetrahydrofolate reductase (NADPH)